MSNLTQFKPIFGAGSIRYFYGDPGASNLPNYLKCDGSIYNQADYPKLYQKIGLISDGTVSYSNWTTRSSGATTYNDVIYGDNLFVASGDGGAIRTSTDGAIWTLRTSGTSSFILGLTYGNGLYVYAGAGGVLATSTNATTWTAGTSGTVSLIYSLTYGNGLYVYAGVGGVLATSTDAITWTARTSGTTSDIIVVKYLNGNFLYGARGGLIATSTDAITWTARTSGTTSDIFCLSYGNGIYVYGGNGGARGYSLNSINWKAISNGPTTFGDIEFAENVFIACGTGGFFITSTDGINWDTRSSGTAVNLSGLTYGGGTMVHVGASGRIATQPGAAYTYDTLTQFVVPKSENIFDTKSDADQVAYIRKY